MLVEAGAGAGKTWTLVERFIFLLGKHVDWPLESIAAVTFTEKAAREMRTRLREAIEKKARGSPPDSVWQAHRRALERLQVGTIHGLCARILRENAIAAGVDPRFEVLDEQQAQLMQEEAVRQTLNALVEVDDPALELLSALQVRDLGEQMSGLLRQRGSVQRVFDHLASPDNLLAGWRAGMADMRRVAWQDLLAANPDLVSAGREVRAAAIQDETDGLAAAVKAVQAGCVFFDDPGQVQAVQHWLEINLRGGRASAWGGPEALKSLKKALTDHREAARELEKNGCLTEIGELDESAAQALQQWHSLWQRTAAMYDRMKAERQSLDFDDLERLAENRGPAFGASGGFCSHAASVNIEAAIRRICRIFFIIVISSVCQSFRMRPI